MLSLADALERLKRAAFRLRIEKNSQTGMWEWGTAFFVGEKIALTAYHNLPSDHVSTGCCTMRGFRQGEWFELSCLVAHSLRESEGDIAVLEVVGKRPAGATELSLGYVPRDAPWRVRAQTWAGRSVCVFGFPFERDSQEGRLVAGLIDTAQPLVERDWKEQHGAGPGVSGWTEWLRIHTDDNATQLEGISGGPILDRETQLVVGVQHSYVRGLKVVYGTELVPLAQAWPAFNQRAHSMSMRSLESASIDTEAKPPAEAVQTAPAPGILPLQPRMLVGRSDVLTALRLLLISCVPEMHRSGIVVVRGTPGVGKTSVAAALAHNLELQSSFSDGILWVSLGQHPDTTVILEDWLTAITASSIPKGLSPTNLKGRLASILSSKRVLLIIDDVWDAKHAELLRVGGTHCATLVTTRESETALAVAQDPTLVYALPGLRAEKAIELLIALAPWVVLQYPDEAYGIVEDFAGLPLAIQVAAHLLNSEMHYGFGGLTVPDLLNEIRNGTALLRARPPVDRGLLANETEIESVAVLLDLSTNRLSDADRMRFALLGAMAPKPATFDMDLIGAVWETGDPKPTIRILIDRGLLEPVPDGRFQMHYLLVLHARELSATLSL